jgi:hypothetical protein
LSYSRFGADGGEVGRTKISLMGGSDAIVFPEREAELLKQRKMFKS